MKKKRLLKTVLASLCLIGGMVLSPFEAMAQGTWTAPAIPGSDISTTNSGNYAIYNIKADAFMGEGMSWGTNAIACRLEGSYTAALANRQKFTLTVSGSTVKMVHANHTDKGVGCASTNANDLYADYASNNVWTFSASPNFANTYTLTLSGYGTLDVADLWGGKLTIKNGKGYTDWAFIPESSLTDGSFAKWKERKAMYDVYTALSNSGTVSTFTTALATANTTYVNNSATVADLRTATRALIIATAEGIQSNTNVSALFTNADMQGNLTTADWSSTGTTISAGAIEVYQAAITLTQQKTDIPDGYYTLIFHGMTRQDGSAAAPTFNATTSNSVTDNASIPFMSACKDTWGVSGSADYVNGIPDRIWRAAEGLAYECASAKIEDFAVTGNNLTLTVAQTATDQWFTFNSFEIQYNHPLYISDIATALPNTALTADIWYYFDIPVAGDYVITAGSNLSNIVYTTNGSQTPLTASTSTWNNSKANLAAGRYYVKSSSAQTLTIEAASYTYTVGFATVDYEYVQGGETVTVTYADAVTNSGEALTINTSVMRFNGNAISNASATANGFTFTIPSGLAAATAYTLTIPAGAVGYTNGNTFNAAQNITIKTPAVFDGTYFLKVAATTTDLSTKSTTTSTVGKYLARGAAWGTHATVDTYGLPIIISTSKYNLSTLQVDDTKRFYHANTASDNGYDLWADQGTDNFVFATNQGLLTISSASNTSAYFKHNDTWPDGEYPSVYFDGTGTNSGPIILWEAETVATHATNMTALKNAQADDAATAAYADDASTYDCLNGISTVAGMETAVAALPYSKVVVGGNAPSSVSEKFEGGNPNPAPEIVYSNTLAIPAPGLYRFSMQAFYRAANNANTQAMHTAGTDLPPVVLFMGDAETQIKSLYDEEGGASAYVSGNDAQYNGMYYANNMDAALMMFQEGKYKNDVWFYATAAGTYSYGVKYMGYANNNAQWFIYSPEAVTVTYYGVDDSYFDKLNVEIAKATAINDYYNNADLTSEIATAQAMYNAYTANQTEVNTEIAALKAKYPTSVSITNGNFDTNPVLLANGSTSSSSANGTASYYINSNDNTTVYMYNTYGWSATSSTINSNAAQGVTGEYGSELTHNGTTPPSSDIYGEANGAALHISAGWGDSPVYTQDVTISNAGRYLLYYEVQNRNTSATTIAANYIGLDGTYSTKTSDFTANTWIRDMVTVDIYESGSYTLSVGIKAANSGSASNAKLWIDNVELYRIGDAVGGIETADGIATVLGTNSVDAINAALTSSIGVLNLEKATGLNSAAISTTNNPNLLIYAKSTSQVASGVKNVIADGTCANLELTKQNSPFIVPTAFTATSSKYTVASGDLAGSFATLIIPFEATTLAGTAYTLNGDIDLMKGKIYGTEASSIAANSPVLVTASGDYSGSNVSVPVIVSGATYTNGELVGVYSATAAPTGSYVLQNHTQGEGVAFYLVGTTQPTVNPFRAYIKSQGSNARSLRVIFDNEASGIENVLCPMSNEDDAVYDLQGRRVQTSDFKVQSSKLKKGLYIVNGRKTVVK